MKYPASAETMPMTAICMPLRSGRPTVMRLPLALPLPPMVFKRKALPFLDDMRYSILVDGGEHDKATK